MFTMQPVYVVISFAVGTLYTIYLGGARRYFAGLRPMIVMFALIAAINPLTNHRGGTVLFMIGDSPFTFEALLYGLCAGGMLICVLVWFMCYQRLITNDKFMYLFGRAAPTSSMVISMILKFVPIMSVRMREIANAQKALGVTGAGEEDSERGRAGMRGAGDADGDDADRGRTRGRNAKRPRGERIRNGVRVSGILISRSMEDSIETADSMRARGYGAGPRTSFSRYRVRARDIVVIVAVSLLFSANILCVFFYGEIVHGQSFRFFPFVNGIVTDPLPYILYATLLLLPLIDEALGRLALFFRSRSAASRKQYEPVGS
jgi:energy-coupling factor transport system permease protein